MLSIILLSYYSGKRLKRVYQQVARIMETNNIPFELIIMDDGSEDDSYSIALEISKQDERVRSYQLSRNYTSFYSIFAGLSLCKGKCATAIPDDEQQPYSILIEMYKLWKKGEKIIYPYRNSREDPFLNKLSARLYYKIMNSISIVKFPPGGIDSFFIDKEIIDILNKNIHPINTSVITEIMRLGFNPKYFPYRRDKSTLNRSRWTFRKKTKLAIDTILSCSSFPIRAISVFGFFISLFSLFLIIFYLYLKIFGNPDYWGFLPTGWTSIVLLLSFFSGSILFSLGIIAEYIWRIYEEVKSRPGYIIKRKE